MAISERPDDSVEDPCFRVPFTADDRTLLEERAPQLVELLDLIEDVQERSENHRSLGVRETLAALRSLEVAGRLVEALSTNFLAHYRAIGDSAVHGYRTTHSLLEGEFRISSKEASRRTHLSDQLTGRVSAVGEPLEPVHPVIAENFADGRISADEAKTLCDAVDDLPPSVRSLYADRVEKTLVELAPTVRLKDIPKLSQRIAQTIDPDGKLPRFETNPLAYTVTLTQQRNGDWRLRGLLDCPTGSTLQALLYGRMKDGTTPITVRPHRGCNAETPGAAAAQSDETGTRTSGSATPADPAAEEYEAREAPESAPSHVPAPATQPDQPDHAAQAAQPAPATQPDQPDHAAQAAQPAPATQPAQPAPADHAAQPAPAAQPAKVAQPAATPQEADREHALDVPKDAQQYSVSSASSDTEEPVPQISEETAWVETSVTAHADATIVVNGRNGTFLEDEPAFYLNEAGWPVHLSKALFDAVPLLLEEARTNESGEAHTLVWEKVVGRAPTHSSERTDRDDPDDLDDPHAGRGVFDDGSPSSRWTAEAGGGSAGLARHDRLAFLIRSVARERVLHGADHALVVTARPEDLTRPNSIVSTHGGSPLSIGQLEKWSQAAQMFVHVVDGGGRTIEVRSQGRFATRSQIAVLAARDQGCTFPDCDAPAEWCEAHHIVPHSAGGETAVDNLTLVCPFHHRWFERSGWESTFHHGFPAWTPPKSVDPRQRTLFHSRFRVALLNLPPELPLTG